MTRGQRIAGLAALALIGFAANSLLCRGALGRPGIDAAIYTLIRLASGAAVLALLAGGADGWRAGTWRSAAALAVYAGLFSAAYRAIGAGSGALILFAAVQATMIGGSAWRGDRPDRRQWVGLAIALLGLALLTLPGATAPRPWAAAAMAAAGAAWGVYSLRGRGVTRPIAATAGNFARATLIAAIVAIAATPLTGATPPEARGVALAVASGALASGLGYACWYAALPELSRITASLLQLTVPVLTAVAGAALLGEAITGRLAAAGSLIVVGVALGIRRSAR